MTEPLSVIYPNININLLCTIKKSLPPGSFNREAKNHLSIKIKVVPGILSPPFREKIKTMRKLFKVSQFEIIGQKKKTQNPKSGYQSISFWPTMNSFEKEDIVA